MAKLIIPVETIGYQATGCYELSKSIDVGQLILSRQSDTLSLGLCHLAVVFPPKLIEAVIERY
ncbi:MAG: hypothetical protein WA753_22200, partial [Pseudolabrys sp.]